MVVVHPSQYYYYYYYSTAHYYSSASDEAHATDSEAPHRLETGGVPETGHADGTAECTGDQNPQGCCKAYASGVLETRQHDLVPVRPFARCAAAIESVSHLGVCAKWTAHAQGTVRLPHRW